MRVLFAAGGTGGHLYPAIAIAQALRARGDEVLFVGTRDRLETRIVPSAGFSLATIAAHPLSRRLSFDVVRTIGANVAGVAQSLRILRRFRPDVVVATGGYVCVPLVFAARLRRLFGRRPPIALLEPNVVPGVANRLLEPLADDVWRASTTGIPVRASLAHLPPAREAAARLGLSPERRTLLVFGGSQGARSINDAVLGLVETGGVPSGWQIALVCGEREYERVRAAARDGVVVKAYLDDPADAYACADLVLARAGASTLAELAALRIPAILVPYPHATEAHQVANARAFAAGGGAICVDDAALAVELRRVLADASSPERLAAMRERMPNREDATTAIVARIDALASRK